MVHKIEIFDEESRDKQDDSKHDHAAGLSVSRTLRYRSVERLRDSGSSPPPPRGVVLHP